MDPLENITQMMNDENRRETTIDELADRLRASMAEFQDLWDALTIEPVELLELQNRFASDSAFHASC